MHYPLDVLGGAGIGLAAGGVILLGLGMLLRGAGPQGRPRTAVPARTSPSGQDRASRHDWPRDGSGARRMPHYLAAYRAPCHGCARTRRIGRDQAEQPYELPAGGRCGGPMMVRPGCRAAGLHCLAELARALPADTAYQITRTAERLGFTDYSDVLAEVANAAIRRATCPKGVQHDMPPRLAGTNFPLPPLTIQGSAESAIGKVGSPGSRPNVRFKPSG